MTIWAKEEVQVNFYTPCTPVEIECGGLTPRNLYFYYMRHDEPFIGKFTIPGPASDEAGSTRFASAVEWPSVQR